MFTVVITDLTVPPWKIYICSLFHSYTLKLQSWKKCCITFYKDFNQYKLIIGLSYSSLTKLLKHPKNAINTQNYPSGLVQEQPGVALLSLVLVYSTVHWRLPSSPATPYIRLSMLVPKYFLYRCVYWYPYTPLSTLKTPFIPSYSPTLILNVLGEG